MDATEDLLLSISLIQLTFLILNVNMQEKNGEILKAKRYHLKLTVKICDLKYGTIQGKK
jgi:hypothetical protein